MKKIIFAMMIVLLFPGLAGAEEVKFSLNGSKDAEANALSRENLHSLYTITIVGTQRITGKPRTLLGRSAEIISAGVLADYFHLFGHEGAHTFAARKNGASRTTIEIGFFEGMTNAWGSFNDSQKLRIATAGLDYVNISAEDMITRSLGRKISATEWLWLGVNQGDPSGYFLIIQRPEDCLENCRNSTKDPQRWYGLVGNSNLETMNKLYSDLRRGAIWQSLGLVAPIYHGVKYWWTGAEYKMSNLWLNPQFDLTNAGVMYTLGIWHKREDGTTLRLRPGFGSNRVKGGKISSLELELSDIPLTERVKWGVRGGLSKILEKSHFVGGSLEWRLSKEMSVGIDGNFYNGNHRNNPKADGSWNEVSFFIVKRFNF